MTYSFLRTTLVACVALGPLAGCADVFFDDFEADTVGANPLTSPAGPPRGDQVSVVDADGIGDNDVSVTSTGALIGAKSVRIKGPTGGVTPQVRFTATPSADFSRPATFDFTGHFTGGGRAEFCVSSTSGGGNCALVVNLSGGEVEVNGDVVATYTPLGTHRVIFTLLPSVDGYSFAISGDADQPGTVSGDLPFPADFPGDQLALQVRLREATTNDMYLMDTVRISTRN